MVWKNCNLILNCDSSLSFKPGDIVTGTLNLEISHEQFVQHLSLSGTTVGCTSAETGICLKIIGLSKANWTRPAPTMPFIKIYSHRTKELEIVIEVFRELYGKKNPPGIYTNNFHFSLPEDLPSSFKSSVSSIKYFIKVKGTAKYNLTKNYIFPFNIYRQLDINNLKNYLTLSETEICKNKRSPEEFTLYFKTYKGVTPNQRVPFEVIIQNNKKIRISRIIVTLIQKRDYNIATGYLAEEKKLCKARYKNFLNVTEEECYFTMNLPEIIPSTIDLNENIIDINYVFRVEVNFKFHSSVIQDVPVIVASVPIAYNQTL